jgi:hypothetical protein
MRLQPSSMMQRQGTAANFVHGYYGTTFAAPCGDAFASARYRRMYSR